MQVLSMDATTIGWKFIREENIHTDLDCLFRTLTDYKGEHIPLEWLNMVVTTLTKGSILAFLPKRLLNTMCLSMWWNIYN